MIKTTRTTDAPKSLQKQSKYDGKDVKEQLKHDFNRKCYLCETVVDKGYEVEHLRPKSEYPELTYTWDNLFLVCRNCNGIKSDRFKDTIIDCCVDDPEAMVSQRIENGILIIEAKTQSKPEKQKEADDTALLLHQCFYGRPPEEGTDIYAVRRQADKCAALREEVKLQTIQLCRELCEYRKLRDTGQKCQKEFDTVRKMIKRSSRYAGFMRSFVRERLDQFPEFGKFVAIEHDTRDCG